MVAEILGKNKNRNKTFKNKGITNSSFHINFEELGIIHPNHIKIKTSKIKSNKKDYHIWNDIKSGLNISCKCSNKKGALNEDKCPFGGDMIWINKGFKSIKGDNKFRIDYENITSKCPLCSISYC